jgi:hypothetical protein
VHLPSQCQRPVQHSLGESQGGASSAVLLPETSLLTVLMYRVGALPVTLLRCSVGAFLVPYLSCFFSPRSLSSLSHLGIAPSYSFSSFIARARPGPAGLAGREIVSRKHRLADCACRRVGELSGHRDQPRAATSRQWEVLRLFVFVDWIFVAPHWRTLFVRCPAGEQLTRRFTAVEHDNSKNTPSVRSNTSYYTAGFTLILPGVPSPIRPPRGDT